jgi:hypothetical protein
MTVGIDSGHHDHRVFLARRWPVGEDRSLLPAYGLAKRRVDDRRVISDIIQVIISGCRWSDAPLDYGPRKALYNRFVRWAVNVNLTGPGPEL